MTPDRLLEFIRSEDWTYIKDRLAESMVKVFSSQSVKNPDGSYKDHALIGQQVVANNTAQEIVEQFINTLEADAEQIQLQNKKPENTPPLVVYQ